MLNQEGILAITWFHLPGLEIGKRDLEKWHDTAHMCHTRAQVISLSCLTPFLYTRLPFRMDSPKFHKWRREIGPQLDTRHHHFWDSKSSIVDMLVTGCLTSSRLSWILHSDNYHLPRMIDGRAVGVWGVGWGCREWPAETWSSIMVPSYATCKELEWTKIALNIR